MQFHYRLILHQGLSKLYIIYYGYNLTIFDRLSNDNKIIWNLNHRQSISRKTFIRFFFYFFYFFHIYLKIHCLDHQDNHCQVILSLDLLKYLQIVNENTSIILIVCLVLLQTQKWCCNLVQVIKYKPALLQWAQVNA
jgi:hypothetical protein